MLLQVHLQCFNIIYTICKTKMILISFSLCVITLCTTHNYVLACWLPNNPRYNSSTLIHIIIIHTYHHNKTSPINKLGLAMLTKLYLCFYIFYNAVVFLSSLWGSREVVYVCLFTATSMVLWPPTLPVKVHLGKWLYFNI